MLLRVRKNDAILAEFWFRRWRDSLISLPAMEIIVKNNVISMELE